MHIKSQACSILDDLIDNFPSLLDCRKDILACFELIVHVVDNNGKILLCGNGGSASDCEHIVGELMKSFNLERKLPLDFTENYRAVNKTEVPSWLQGTIPAISLISQTSLLSAISNDNGSEGVFAQQVYGYGVKGDVLIGISTSGNSKNIVEAFKVARAMGIYTVCLTGSLKSSLSSISNISIMVPEDKTYRIQELHLPVYHCLCAMVEAHYFYE